MTTSMRRSQPHTAHVGVPCLTRAPAARAAQFNGLLVVQLVHEMHSLVEAVAIADKNSDGEVGDTHFPRTPAPIPYTLASLLCLA